jgi:prepilin-type processing-associated H-X9-DG protein/prepilin-type N-terminal cleavage/methylation domain-containing protein
MRHTSALRDGFSLVELLVVIAIIIILLSILLPTLGHVRESARQVVCATHLREIAAAYLMYVKANHGQGPSPARAEPQLADDWIFWNRDIEQSALAPYLAARGPNLRTLLRCPSAGERVSPHTAYPYNYSTNTGLWRVYWLNQPRLPITKVRNPTEKSLFYDEDDAADDGAFWYQTPSDNLTDRHRGRGNIAFFDGHVDLEYPTFAHERAHNDPVY